MATQHLDLDEQEKLDQIKDFWRRYGNFITWVAIVVFGAYGAWLGYNNWQVRKATEASTLFGAFELAVQEGDEARIGRAVQDLDKDYAKTTYAQQAKLLAAKFYGDKGNLDAAKAQLQAVADNASDEGYRALARLRLAGVWIDQKNLDAALQVLAIELPPAFAALGADRKGDIYALQGKAVEARAAYEKAYTLAGEKSPYRPMIEVKMRALGAEPPTPASAASAAKSG
jgi:predicted negative regulator of RcsB-dependent stress response